MGVRARSKERLTLCRAQSTVCPCRAGSVSVSPAELRACALPHRDSPKSCSLNSGKEPPRQRARVAYSSLPRTANTWHKCYPVLRSPLKGLLNQRSAVCMTWAESTPQIPQMAHPLIRLDMWERNLVPPLKSLRSLSAQVHRLLSTDAINTVAAVSLYIRLSSRGRELA